ncbi:MAG: hypothetical protein RI947_506 [Candidatus Parcubacteria bacterium]|jgi:8-oxo-dGTP diphosphatase
MNRDRNELHQVGVTLRVILFTIEDDQLSVVVTKRTIEPFKGSYNLPGGFIHNNESLEQAASRIVQELTGDTHLYTEQLYTFGDPDRDTNGWWITVAYFALLPQDMHTHAPFRINPSCALLPVEKLPTLAFDHATMIEYAVNRLKAKVQYTNIAQGLLPEKFRLTSLQKTYEIILNKPLDKRNFRKKMSSLGLLQALNEKEISGRHRPATLYKFKTKEQVFFD